MRALLLALGLALFWLALSGMWKPLLLAFGVVSVVVVVAIAVRLRLVDEEGVPAHTAPRMVLYLPWLVKEVVLANLDVARRIFGRRRAIRPRLVSVPTTGLGPLGKAIYAHSITLTPGTVAITVGTDSILVHTIHQDVGQELLAGAMLDKVRALEGLPPLRGGAPSEGRGGA